MSDDGQAEFCRREWPRLVGALSFYCRDVAIAEELAQEALARAIQHWDRVRDLESPGGWVHHVGINLATSHLRRRRVQRDRQATVAGGAQPVTDPDLAEAIAVRAAVGALPLRQRTALVLRYYSDLPVAEVARLMGCREGTVKALTAQAVAALRASGLLAGVREVLDA